MKYDIELTLRTELDTYAKQSITFAVRDAPTFETARDELLCQINEMPYELRNVNKHTINCIFGEEDE